MLMRQPRTGSNKMNARALLGSLLAGIALAATAPAMADVKAGMDAWDRGDLATAIREWEGPAAHGDPDAQLNLGNAYRLGAGVPQDRAKAEDLISKSAAQGNIKAADLYGLILFDKGERQRALPYVRAAADRGDPRAQYLLGIAHFNGELVPKDWVRAYALISLAVEAGTVPMAPGARAQMDQYIPLAQRQEAVGLATELAAQADATRQRQLAAIDLGNTVKITDSAAPPPLRKPRTPPSAAPSVAAAEDAVAAAARVAGNDSPRTAGADYARPQVLASKPPVAAVSKPPIVATATPRPALARPAQPPAAVAASLPAPATAAGAWKIQLGAFGVASNADALWNRIKSRPELSGHSRINARTGAVTKLQAGGYTSQQEAQAACSRLSAAGFTCIATR
jgi:cell division septation protein DedD